MPRIFLFALITYFSLNLAFAQTYGGPSITGVPSVSAGSKAGRPDGLFYFAGVMGTYDSGITPVSVNSQGQLVQTGGLYGATVNWGLSGRHRGRHSLIGLNYFGNYRHYSQNTYYNGLDSVLSLDIETQLSRRLQWFSATQAGSVSTTFGAWASYAGLVPGGVTPGVPVNDIYDNRNYFLAHNEALTYLVSPRLSVTGGGTGIAVRRQSKALAGMDGYGAFGTIAYRLTRRTTSSLTYGWNHYDYPHQFGEADMHNLLAGFARQLSPRWTGELHGGVFRIETQGLIRVSADPALVALFGQTSTIERFYREKYYPAVMASLKGNYRRFGLTFGYSRRPSPGNGVYLASASQTGSAAVTYTGIRKWNFGADVYYSQLASVAQHIGTYSNTSAGGGATYRLYRNLSATMRADARTWQIDRSTAQIRNGYRVMIGVALSPSDLPLSLW